MLRRLHVEKVHLGSVAINAAQLHHARHVLRLTDGASVQLFDDDGRSGDGLLDGDYVRVGTMTDRVAVQQALTIAAAVPKGDRADWMVEKLSELGVEEFIPLACARSIVLPEGQGKRSRWERIAIESAKQSRRSGVMRIGALVKPLAETFPATFHGPGADNAWYLSTASNSVPIVHAIERSASAPRLVYIGPEGGWTEQECAAFDQAGVTAVKLTGTILRVETAAVAVAAVLMTSQFSSGESESGSS